MEPKTGTADTRPRRHYIKPSVPNEQKTPKKPITLELQNGGTIILNKEYKFSLTQIPETDRGPHHSRTNIHLINLHCKYV